ncbi:MAG: carboxypeptidase-like regulatory domain-containing protein [Prevotellaceae bacterium]|jgi:hypothetical protein|nr:carboxypeptidase-like regulatory domain-containing protein [Prevotellaceae bacterium]
MKKISFIALMGILTLMTTSCNKETEIIDKTEYDVIILVKSSDDRPLKDVTLTLLDYNKITKTNSDGKATFNLPNGDYRLQVEKSGYSSYSSSNSFDGIDYTNIQVRGNTYEPITLYSNSQRP